MTSSTLSSLIILTVFSALVSAQQTFFPASVPLSIRSPYISVWEIATNNSGPISNSWPHFWGQQSIIGWAGKIRVDGKTYVWMGQDGIGDSANVTSVQITPTQSIYNMQAGPMNVTVTYLSPIEPSDWVKQSLPFSYVYVEASSLDGVSHAVQVYSDISAEWLSGNRSSLVKWNTQNTESGVIHEVELQSPQPNQEIANQASDGKAYYAMASRPGLTWQIDNDAATREQFSNSGSLTNIASSAFGGIGPPFPVFAIAADLGQIQSTASPVAWAVGYVRDPSVQYTAPSGETQDRRPYFVTQYSDIHEAIDAFTSDFSAARDRAIALDEKIMGDAAKISPRYADLVSLASRQTMGSLDITVLGGPKGSVDASDVKIFMKDIGTSARVNPVERMYAAFPAYLYLNASLAGALLSPLLEAQDKLSGLPYAIQDLGTTYPVASGFHGAHQQGVEQSGNMLIMLYAHARISGDGTLLARHYNVTKRWADFLVENALMPENQQNADGEDDSNMSNLAIKGIIAVKAMAEISRAVGVDINAQQYDNHASALLGSWESLAQSNTQQRILRVYGQQQSWALMYNLYADILLGTRLVSQSLLDGQTQFYSTLLPIAPPFGLPIDNNPGSDTSAAWTLFTSATVSDEGVRNQLIDGVWSRASSNLTQGAFPDKYNGATGGDMHGNAGPALGAMFAHLALTVPNQMIVVPNNAALGGGNLGSDSSNGSTTGPIVGGVLGGVAIIAIAVATVFFWRRHKSKHTQDGEKVEIMEDGHRPSLSPYYYELANQNPAALTSSSLRGASPNPGGSQYIDPGVAGLGAAAMGAFDSRSDSYAYAPNATYDDTPLPMSSKARERALNMPQVYAPPSVVSSSVAESAAPSASSRDPLSPEGGSSGSRSGSGDGSRSLSPTDVIGLRAEVENLRRVMQEIRAERFEPPPQYGT